MAAPRSASCPVGTAPFLCDHRSKHFDVSDSVPLPAADVFRLLRYDMAIGPPNNEQGQCTADDSYYVSLGGLGGSLVVSFANLEAIEPGDMIKVYECGDGVEDAYQIHVGVGTSVNDPQWIVCGQYGSVAECTVPELPDIPVN